MKILVITYSKEVNPGTFLQAYGVQYGLKEIYPRATIELINHNKYVSSYSSGKKLNKRSANYIKAKLRAIPRRLKYELLYEKLFKFSKQKFDLFQFDKQAFNTFLESYDLVVVGSDTILIQLKDQNNNYGLMWLLESDVSRVYFAASSAPVNYTLSNHEAKMLKSAISKSKFIGLRDTPTYDLFKNSIGIEQNLVLQPDPSYLIPDSQFKLGKSLINQLAKVRCLKKIVLCNFNDRFEYKEQLTQTLKKLGFYVISTLYNPNASRNIMSLSPFQWAALFQHVDFVITERFHDCVFALRANKTVIAVDWNEKRFSKSGFSKTKFILTQYHVENFHYIVKTKADFVQLACEIPDKLRMQPTAQFQMITEQIKKQAKEILLQINTNENIG